ncbi:MAG: phosphate ABC transporter permease subunit PstC [Planctomycetaceae bacterium]|nr:phosphate ABC transporter permease subunit PstC [Planctomycetaceae bacterium]
MDTASNTSPSAAFLRRKASGSGAQKPHETAIGGLLRLCALISILTTVGIIIVLLNDSVFSMSGGKAFFQHVSLKQFLFDTKWLPDAPTPRFGIWPLICGTIMVSGIACLIGVPLGLGAAIYLSEYAHPHERNLMKPVLELLAGVPTVVYGYFGLTFITPFVLKPIFEKLLGMEVGIYNVASGGIVVGIMITPMVASISEDVFRAVPRSLRDAAYALGATQFDVSMKVVVPAALSGILAAVLLAFSRAIGETMAVTIACGSFRQISVNPFESMQTMTGYIVDASFGEDDAEGIVVKSAYAVALSLFLMTLAINVISQMILRRFREVYE